MLQPQLVLVRPEQETGYLYHVTCGTAAVDGGQ